VRLGAIAAGLARAGADKLTLALSPKLAELGPAIAACVGRHARGRVVPVVGEPAGRKDRYGIDRLFVSALVGGESHDATPLAHAGHPVVQWRAGDAELTRWEVAARVMGAALEMSAQSSAAAISAPGTISARDAISAQGAPSNGDAAALQSAGLSLFAAPDHATVLRKAAGFLGAQVAASAAGWIAAHLALADENDFVALIGDVADLGAAQAAIRDATRLACTAGRDLASAGALHEARGGHFILIGETAPDFAALLARGLRVLQIRAEGGDRNTVSAALQAAVKLISR
jgi:hypothetical protein